MPNRAQSRKDPQNGQNGFATNKGFTLIELMITIGVIAIIASLALPSYRTIIEKRQVTSAAEQFGAFFGVVKSHAVKRNQDIAMYPKKRTVGGEDEWCLGFKVFDTNACDCFDGLSDANACSVDLNNDGTIQENELTVLKSESLRKPETLTGIAFLQGETAVTNKFFVFDAVRGFLDVSSNLYADNMRLSFVRGQYALELRIDRLGRTFICSAPSATIPVPGYDPC